MNEKLKLYSGVRQGKQGRVVVSFVVDRDGSISDAQIAGGADSALDEEALRIIKEMPNWILGRQNGTPVRVKYCLPIIFRLK